MTEGEWAENQALWAAWRDGKEATRPTKLVVKFERSVELTMDEASEVRHYMEDGSAPLESK